MIKSSRWITDLGSELIQPFEREYVNPASLDLRWSGLFVAPTGVDASIVDTWNRERRPSLFSPPVKVNQLVLKPKHLVLIDTLEKISMPNDVAGLVKLKSSLSRIGLNSLNAGWIDPGFGNGEPSTITIAITNEAPFSLRIRPGQPLFQIIFFGVADPADGYNGHYQGQQTPAI